MMTQADRRADMVRTQLAGRDIRDEAVLRAMGTVEREQFVLPAYVEGAYEDHPLPIGHGQTISQPYMVAHTAQLLSLRPGDKVLDVGGGSGYQAAILAEIVGPTGAVYTIERLPELEKVAEERLRRLNYSNVQVRCGDGSLGWQEAAPFDAIAVAAGSPRVPQALLDQLSEQGRLVIPVGDREEQRLLLIQKDRGRFQVKEDIPCVYVDLVGASGW